MSTAARRFVGLLLLITLIGAGFALLHRGVYGFTLFVLFPVLLGGLTSWVFRPATATRAAGLGALTVMAALCSLLLVGWEGLICIAMALPLALPLGALGGWLVYRVSSFKLATPGFATLLLVSPASVIWDANAPPPVFEVRSAIEIAVPPEKGLGNTW